MSRIEKIRIKVEVVSFKTGIDFFIIPGVLKRLFCFQKCSPDEKATFRKQALRTNGEQME